GYHYYRVRSVGKDGQVQYTQIVKVLIGKMDATISVYPNPIVNGNIHLEFNNEPAGVYGVRLMNSLGQIIVVKVINHGGGNSMEEITPGQQLAKGIYQLEITKPDGTVKIVKVIN
ncbi:MAG: T9SS type A sorting domain-containing protein, partial [Ginsengibacter sp.]